MAWTSSEWSEDASFASHGTRSAEPQGQVATKAEAWEAYAEASTPLHGTEGRLRPTGQPSYPPGVAVSCPSCGSLLADGALRCKACGADARAAEPVSGAGVTVTAAGVAPDAFRAAALADELHDLAPETLAEWKRLDLPRKRRVSEILAELWAFVRRG